MRVAKVKDEWPEMAERSRKWMSFPQAAKRVNGKTSNAFCSSPQGSCHEIGDPLDTAQDQVEMDPIMEISMDRVVASLRWRGSTSETGPVGNDKARSRVVGRFRTNPGTGSNRARTRSDTCRERSGKRRRDLSPMADSPYRWLGAVNGRPSTPSTD